MMESSNSNTFSEGFRRQLFRTSDESERVDDVDSVSGSRPILSPVHPTDSLRKNRIFWSIRKPRRNALRRRTSERVWQCSGMIFKDGFLFFVLWMLLQVLKYYFGKMIIVYFQVPLLNNVLVSCYCPTRSIYSQFFFFWEWIYSRSYLMWLQILLIIAYFGHIS